jgi:tRNA(Ile)-lysidine synthase TilS/MesJ
MEYIEYALSDSCHPDFIDPSVSPPPSLLDRSVLDECCENWDEFLVDAKIISEEEKKLKSSLVDFFNANDLNNTPFILSLSGGVDSMSMAVLLKELGVNFAAVHIRHSSRIEDTEKELRWVHYVCHHLGAPLYYHHVQVARPHGTDGDGLLTREQFEEKTRDIRFSMYAKAFRTHFPSERSVRVIIGHHMDDVDENRIAELGKGNLLNIDGMSEVSSFASVFQLRPLCGFVRKNVIKNFALIRQIPHMQNSTPKWSRRGWIRDVIDGVSADDRDWILNELNMLGSESTLLDRLVLEVGEKWRNSCTITPKTISSQSKSKTLTLPCYTLPISDLIALLDPLSSRFNLLALQAASFGDKWNHMFSSFVPTGVSCPIQPIRSLTAHVMTELVFRVLQFSSIREILEMDKFVPKKSVAQLIDLVVGEKRLVTWKVAHRDFVIAHVAHTWCIVTVPVDASSKKALVAGIDRLELRSE